MMVQNGSGGYGSIPALVMRSGLIRPMSPEEARRDITTQHVLDITAGVTGQGGFPPMMPMSPLPQVTPLLPAAPGPVTTAVAQTVVAVPPMPIPHAPDEPPPARPSDRLHWHHQHHREHPMITDIKRLHPQAAMHGVAEVELGEWNGKPVAKFEIAASPPAAGAQSAANMIRGAARALVQSGLAAMPAQLVGGPISALMRGGAVELHFQNGVVVRTAL